MVELAETVREILGDGPKKRKDLVAAIGVDTETWNGVGYWVELVRIPPSGTWDSRRADLYGLEIGPGQLKGKLGRGMLETEPMDLAVSYTGGSGDCAFDLLLGRFHYLVWDPSPDQSSGPIIAATLSGCGFTGTFSQILPIDQLEKYRTIWISLGVYSGNYVIGANSAEALAIEGFQDLGGCVYMEGADLWYYAPSIGGHNFNVRFGLMATSDGTGDCGPVNGNAGTFCEGMTFAYNGENNYIDHLGPLINYL